MLSIENYPAFKAKIEEALTQLDSIVDSEQSDEDKQKEFSEAFMKLLT